MSSRHDARAPSPAQLWRNALLSIWFAVVLAAAWLLQAGPSYELLAQRLPWLASAREAALAFFTRPYVF